MNYQLNSFMGYNLFDGDINSISDSGKIVINTINQYSFCLAERDADFKHALYNSDILLPDGIGIVVAVKVVTGYDLKKISGADLHESLLKKLDKKKGRCLYLGSSKSTLDKITLRLSREYPNIICESYSPSFKDNFSDEENIQMITFVNEFQPDILFVGMTAPKQEKWVTKHKDLLNAKVICSIGAVFDFYAGTINRPSQFWIDNRLEWFVRFVKEPKRMWKRYFYYGPIFVWALFKEKLAADLNPSSLTHETQKQ